MLVSQMLIIILDLFLILCLVIQVIVLKVCTNFSWLYDETNGTVAKILQEEPASDTRLVLASFVNMEPRWLYPFDPVDTSNTGLFYLPGGER